MLYFIAAKVVKQSEPYSKLCAFLFGRRDLVNNCEKAIFFFFEVFQIRQVVFCWCQVYRMSKPKLSLEQNIMSGHNYWDTSSKVLYSTYSMY